jgi:hypothetical protein
MREKIRRLNSQYFHLPAATRFLELLSALAAGSILERFLGLALGKILDEFLARSLRRRAG